jgi:hypothetical protein
MIHIDGVTCVVAIIVFFAVVMGALYLFAPHEPPGKRWG